MTASLARISGVPRVPTCEIMLFTGMVRKIVLESQDSKLGDAIRIGAADGMQDFTMSLKDLVDRDLIDRATAFEVAPNVDALKASRDAAATQFQTLYARQQELAVDISLQRGGAEVIAAAKMPTSPVSPRPLRDAAARRRRQQQRDQRRQAGTLTAHARSPRLRSARRRSRSGSRRRGPSRQPGGFASRSATRSRRSRWPPTPRRQ